MEHICDEFIEMSGEFNSEEEHGKIFDSGNYGPSIASIIGSKKSGKWFAYNDEYATQINFCPFCGKKLSDLNV